MREVILIDDDAVYMQAVDVQLGGRVRLYQCDPHNAVLSGIALAVAEKHRGALILIDLDLKDRDASRSSSAALFTVNELRGTHDIPADTMCVCSLSLESEIPSSVKDTLAALGVQHVDKGQIAEWIEQHEAPPRSQSRDQLWATSSQEIRRDHAEKIVAVYNCRVWGSGETTDACLDEAARKPGAPELKEFVLVRVPALPDEEAWIPADWNVQALIRSSDSRKRATAEMSSDK